MLHLHVLLPILNIYFHVSGRASTKELALAAQVYSNPPGSLYRKLSLKRRQATVVALAGRQNFGLYWFFPLPSLLEESKTIEYTSHFQLLYQ